MEGRELTGALGISINRKHFILHHELHMKKAYARWVPRLLTASLGQPVPQSWSKRHTKKRGAAPPPLAL